MARNGFAPRTGRSYFRIFPHGVKMTLFEKKLDKEPSEM